MGLLKWGPKLLVLQQTIYNGPPSTVLARKGGKQSSQSSVPASCCPEPRPLASCCPRRRSACSATRPAELEGIFIFSHSLQGKFHFLLSLTGILFLFSFLQSVGKYCPQAASFLRFYTMVKLFLFTTNLSSILGVNLLQLLPD
jgi:hypothetical protein